MEEKIKKSGKTEPIATNLMDKLTDLIYESHENEHKLDY
jgi:hypothetical protein